MSFAKRYLNRHIQFELAPVLVFFVANYGWGLLPATIALMLATVVFTSLGIWLERRVPVFPLVTLVLVLALGGASLVFQNEVFIKIKPTVAKCLFALALAAGLGVRHSLLARALDGQVQLTEQGWRVLTVRWIVFALALAAANEMVWRTFSTDAWVAFKTALTPLSIAGYIVITRLTAPRYWRDDAEPATPEVEMSRAGS